MNPKHDTIPEQSYALALKQEAVVSGKAFSRPQQIVTVLAVVLAIAAAAHAQSFSVIYNFGTYGSHPRTGLTTDARGNLYGTTNAGTGTAGSVFELSPRGSGWIYTPLYNFRRGPDGVAPLTRPVFGPGGLLFGTTAEGGGEGCLSHGCGTIYTLRPGPHAPADVLRGWEENVIYHFAGGADGAGPFGDLIFDGSGILDGVDNVGVTGWGAVYSLTPHNGGWSLAVLYNFTGGSDGGGISDGVIFDGVGRLYGATFLGGAYNYGTVFRLTPSGSGWNLETLYSFQGANDGNGPAAGLTFDAAGNLYGSTLYGGSGGGGTVFKLSPSGASWTLTTLYSFTGAAGSFAKLVLDAAGNLYGTTFADGLYQQGNIFKLTPLNGGWNYTSLHDFTGGDDGALPGGGVVFDSAGNMYGTTENGGHQFGNGVVWEIAP